MEQTAHLQTALLQSHALRTQIRTARWGPIPSSWSPPIGCHYQL